MSRLLVIATLLFAYPAQAVVEIDWVTVRDPGNAADTTGYGAVAYPYQIGQYEVTNAQYAEFLNAVAATDTNGLYNANMGSGLGGIARSGSSGSYTYSAIAGREDMPVNWVSFWDATRFANWLHNEQPTGAQDDSTTEDGAYTLTPTGITNNTVTRNPGAGVFVPSEDEWYKAAYYHRGPNAGYWAYPARSHAPTSCSVPSGLVPNIANCENVVGDFTEVGSYAAAFGPNGTLDQGGNVKEWNESTLFGSNRVYRGGGYSESSIDLAASTRFGRIPVIQNDRLGFRVASPAAPAPPVVPALGPIGLLLVAAGLLGFGGCRRGRP